VACAIIEVERSIMSTAFDPDFVPLDDEEAFLEWSRQNTERLAAAQAERMKQWEYMRSPQFKKDILETTRPEGEAPWEDG
jgi:hypothetical protein